jgi:hypothetical protein
MSFIIFPASFEAHSCSSRHDLTAFVARQDSDDARTHWLMVAFAPVDELAAYACVIWATHAYTERRQRTQASTATSTCVYEWATHASVAWLRLQCVGVGVACARTLACVCNCDYVHLRLRLRCVCVAFPIALRCVSYCVAFAFALALALACGHRVAGDCGQCR